MLQTASVRRLADAPASVLRWTLDTPADERAVDVSSGSLRVQGWLLRKATGEAAPQVLARRTGDAGTEVQRFPFNNDRPDVVQRVLGEAPAGHAQLRSGFSFKLLLDTVPFDLGFDLGSGEPFWAATIDLRAGLKVIEGRDGWLFLDNDSNRSVDQYTGALRLDPAGLRLWRGYFADCRALAARVGARNAVVVAPAKEEVLRDFYPHPRAATTVLDQVRAVAQPLDHFVDGAAVLRGQPDPASLFMRTDTHWTDRGAMLTTLAVVEALGLETGWARVALSKDAYRVVSFAGDLGVKLLPPRSAPTEFLDAPVPASGAVFDNGLPNIGRVLIFDAPQAPFDDSLLMFGASSGYPMLKYLKRLFRRVVFVHSAGNVDPEIVLHEQPGSLLLQSNGRFLIQPPRADFSLRRAVATKIAEGGETVRRRLDGLLAGGPRPAADAPYLEMLQA